MATTVRDRDVTRARAAKVCRDKGIILPTFEQLAHPEKIPASITTELHQVGLWDINPRNLFRITWKNEPVEKGGGFGKVNRIVLPSLLTGCSSPIVLLAGKFFPTGAHKVGATYGPLVSRLVEGRFDPESDKALWPSTGNYCRGGAYNSKLLGCKAVAVLPEGMSRERFDWLKKTDAEIHATHGCESNVKEVFDKAHELSAADPSVVVLNQFAEFNNPLFHYYCTGGAMEEVFEEMKEQRGGDLSFAGIFLTQGSGGTLGAAEYTKEKFPRVKVGAGEAIQCPTLLFNGYGDHRIEGIGDKHVPWIINVRNLDTVVDLDDDHCMRLLRLFNEPAGTRFLKAKGLPESFVDNDLPLLGISGIANMLGCMKMGKYFEFGENDALFSVATDSVDMYRSRLDELNAENGPYTEVQAAIDFEVCIGQSTTDGLLEMRHTDKKRMHNLKYFTWVEQQGKTVEELNQQWTDPDYWKAKWQATAVIDEEIRAFNKLSETS